MPKVFIIILNYNNGRDTVACLDSLKSLDYPNYEIVVVDNGSTDDSVERIRNYESGIKKFTFIANKDNAGFSAGNNVGINYALKHDAEYVLLLNNDTLIESGFLKKIIEVGESDQKIGILGPRINYAEPKERIWFNGGMFGWPLQYNYHLDFEKDERELKSFEPKKVDFITGAAMLIRKDVFEKIGMLDERFFLYFEDMEFCLRAETQGFSSVVVSDAKIYHKVSQSVRHLKQSVIWYYHMRNYLLLIHERKGFLLNITTAIWSHWVEAKQTVKQILFPQKREGARYIKQAITDFRKGQFGKYENRN